MKTSIIILFSFPVLLTACSRALKADQLPSVVVNAVKEKFVSATDMEWKKSGNFYEAEFMFDGKEYTAEIDSSGTLSRYKIDIREHELPVAIVQFLESQYKGQKVDDVEKVDVKGGMLYQVELEMKPNDVELVFSFEGVLVKDQPYWD